MRTLVGGVEMRNRLTHMWWLSIGWDISGAELPPEEQGVQLHTVLPSPRFQCWKRSLHNIWLWKSVENRTFQVRWKASGNPDVLLKTCKTHLFADTYSGLRHRDGDYGGSRDTQGKTELCEGWRDSHHYPCVEASSCTVYRWVPSFYLEPFPHNDKAEFALAWWTPLTWSWLLPQKPPN